MKVSRGLTLNIKRIILQNMVNKAQGGGKFACLLACGNCSLSYKKLSLAFWATPTQETLTTNR